MAKSFSVLGALGLILNGCAGGGAGPLGIGAIIGDRNLAAAEPLFSEREERCLDSADQLLAMLFGPELPDDDDAPAARGRKSPRCYEIARSFQYVMKTSPTFFRNIGAARYSKEQRNEIIDALIATSNRKCTRYTALLKNADGAVNASLSVGAIITGGLGAFVGGVETAKALSGSAAILSGSREAINETYLSNITIQVLAAAMEKARDRLRRTITNRQACQIDSYTLTRGIEDAFQYHGACSISAGLAEAAISIERSENPGLDAMRNTMAQYAALMKQVGEFGGGSISSIAGAPSVPDLASVNEANGKLATAQAEVATLGGAVDDLTKKANDAKKAAVEAEKVSTAPGATPADVAAAAALDLAAVSARAAATKKTTELNDASMKRDGLMRNFANQLQKLASGITYTAAAAVTPESRQCPYGPGA